LQDRLGLERGQLSESLGDQGELTCAVAGEACGRMELHELHDDQRRPACSAKAMPSPRTVDGFVLAR
jgi:hypothetical protein